MPDQLNKLQVFVSSIDDEGRDVSAVLPGVS